MSIDITETPRTYKAAKVIKSWRLGVSYKFACKLEREICEKDAEIDKMRKILRSAYLYILDQSASYVNDQLGEEPSAKRLDKDEQKQLGRDLAKYGSAQHAFKEESK